jgi:hypothetical protein
LFFHTFFYKWQIFYVHTVNNALEGNHLEEATIEIGNIKHYFSKINVAVVQLTLPLSVGDRIQIKGPQTDFEQTVDSMQIDRKTIPRAEGGQSIGLKLEKPAHERDVVYKKI